MNRERRRRLQTLRDELESLRDEEEEAFGNMPDSIQSSDRGQRVADAADSLASIVDDVDELLEQ